MGLVQAIEGFAGENGILSVGGLYPVLRVDGTAGGDLIEAWGYTREIPVGGSRIQLAFENGQWEQRNLTTGRVVRLVPPWQVESFRNVGVFDDVDRAYRRFRPRE